MSATKTESFGFLPWVAILLGLIGVLFVYICAALVWSGTKAGWNCPYFRICHRTSANPQLPT